MIRMNATLGYETLGDLPVVQLPLQHGAAAVGGHVQLSRAVQVQDLIEQDGTVVEEVLVRLRVVFRRCRRQTSQARVRDLFQCGHSCLENCSSNIDKNCINPSPFPHSKIIVRIRITLYALVDVLEKPFSSDGFLSMSTLKEKRLTAFSIDFRPTLIRY